MRQALGQGASYGPIHVTALSFGAEQRHQRIDRRAWIAMRIEPPPSCGADPAPLPDEHGAAEQVGPDLHAIVAPLILLGFDPNEGGCIRDERQLHGFERRGQSLFWSFGHGFGRSVSFLKKSGKPLAHIFSVFRGFRGLFDRALRADRPFLLHYYP
jgi:hypothetical protein